MAHSFPVLRPLFRRTAVSTRRGRGLQRKRLRSSREGLRSSQDMLGVGLARRPLPNYDCLPSAQDSKGVSMKNRVAVLAIVLTALPLTALPLGAQERAARQLTAADYMRAERTLVSHTTPMVFGATVRPTWVSGERFWYRNAIVGGTEFVVVDADQGTRERAFDHFGLGRALSSITDVTYGGLDLPFTEFEFVESGGSISFELDGRSYVCDVGGQSCAEGAEIWDRSPFAVTSPDGSTAAFIRDYNLWIRDLATGEERALTADGVEDYGYATDNAGWTRSDRAVLLWSPDSRKIATFQQDQRGVGEMYLVDTRVGHSTLQAWKYPLP
ncbi:MAG TPA: hypothetical protein EYQ27_11845, partial [Gemmatimonadetes bacterium]|nr:hypothetical protein [Gemmatimonadota bacterium]